MNIHDWSKYRAAFPTAIVLVWDIYVCVCMCFSVFLCPCVGGKKRAREGKRKERQRLKTRQGPSAALNIHEMWQDTKQISCTGRNAWSLFNLFLFN